MATFSPQTGIKITRLYNETAKRWDTMELGRIYRQIVFDSATLADMSQPFEGVDALEAELMPEGMVLDAVTSRYSKLPSQIKAVQRVLNKKIGKGLSVESGEVGKIKKTGLYASVAAIYKITDGQTVSIIFHAPDGDPKSIQANDTLIAFRFLLNRSDITAHVAPKRNGSVGIDLSLSEVTAKIAQLIENNTDKFAKNRERVEAQKLELETTNAKITEYEQSILQATQLEIDAERTIETQSAKANRLKAELDKLIAENDALEERVRAKPVTEAIQADASVELVNRALSEYGAKLTDGFIEKNGKILSVKVVRKGARIRFEEGAGKLIFSGPIKESTVSEFVEKQWFWEKGKSHKEERPKTNAFSGATMADLKSWVVSQKVGGSIDRKPIHRFLIDWYKSTTGETMVLDALSPLEFERTKSLVFDVLTRLPSIDADELWLDKIKSSMHLFEKLEEGIGTDVVKVAELRRAIDHVNRNISDISAAVGDKEKAGAIDILKHSLDKLEHTESKRAKPADLENKDSAIRRAKVLIDGFERSEPEVSLEESNLEDIYLNAVYGSIEEANALSDKEYEATMGLLEDSNQEIARLLLASKRSGNESFIRRANDLFEEQKTNTGGFSPESSYIRERYQLGVDLGLNQGEKDALASASKMIEKMTIPDGLSASEMATMILHSTVNSKQRGKLSFIQYSITPDLLGEAQLSLSSKGYLSGNNSLNQKGKSAVKSFIGANNNGELVMTSASENKLKAIVESEIMAGSSDARKKSILERRIKDLKASLHMASSSGGSLDRILEIKRNIKSAEKDLTELNKKDGYASGKPEGGVTDATIHSGGSIDRKPVHTFLAKIEALRNLTLEEYEAQVDSLIEEIEQAGLIEQYDALLEEIDASFDEALKASMQEVL